MNLQHNVHKKNLFVFLGIAVLCNILWAAFRLGGFENIAKLISVFRSPQCKNCNVVLVTLDVCSAHNIQCYGYNRNTAPNFCAYAKESTFFQNAYANGVFTLPSHASIFTGLIPSHHGINTPNVDALAPKIPLLSDVLHSHGYETHFYMSNDVQLPVSKVYGRGMTSLDEEGINTVQFIDKAMSTLIQNDKEGKKTFVSFYSSTCHEPYYTDGEKPMFTSDENYRIPKKVSDVFWTFTEGFYQYLIQSLAIDTNTQSQSTKSAFLKQFYQDLSRAPTYMDAERVYKQAVSDQPEDYIGFYNYDYYYTKKIDVKNKKQMEYLKALYDQKIFEADRDVVGPLKQYIKNSPLKNNTIVVITSEHGQEFGEHEIFGHTTLYDLNMKVPMLLSVPDSIPRTVSANVQGVDIMPTILDLVGIQHTFAFDGLSLVPLLQGRLLPERVLVADGGFWDDPKKKSFRKGHWKVLAIQEGNHYMPYELYNTKTDPLETHDVLSSNFLLAKAIIGEYLKTHK